MRPIARILTWLAAAALALAVFFVVTLAIPVPSWRTGRQAVPPLDLVEGGPKVDVPRRVWIDADAACGAEPRTDPDDCFAIALLAQARNVKVVGLSTVYGNAPLDVTDRTARTLAGMLERSGGPGLPVHTGAAAAPGGEPVPDSPAVAALRQALADGPLTIIGLGPFTNVAAALRGRPDLQRNVGRLIAVMGRRPGHIFHPAEGENAPMLLGHGPVFRDLNLAKDARAAADILAMGLPITLVPYDAARRVHLTAADLDRIGRTAPALRWIAARSRGWLEFWRQDIGQDGFAPFDLVAAAYALEPTLFDCASAAAWVAPDRTLWHDWFYNPDALLVGRRQDKPAQFKAAGQVFYCPRAASGLHDWLVARLDASDESVKGQSR